MSQLSSLNGNSVPNIALVNLGFDNFGMRDPIPTNITDQIINTNQEFPNSGINGAKIESLSVARLTAGSMKIDTYIQSTGYVAGTSGWRIDGAGNAEFNSLTLTGGTISYGKTSFSDSTHAGYYISSAGFYIGAASDTTKLKYTLATGLFDFIGTISSRSTATVAASINSSGNLVTDIINARLDSSAKTLLAGFTFGSADYAGAVNAGTITWNTTTGAITGGSGVILYRGGIIGVNSGSTTFSIDASTGAATFGGALSAPTGTIGGWTIGSSTLTASSGGNTTTLSSGATSFSSGPTGTPTVTITQAGVITATGGIFDGTSTLGGRLGSTLAGAINSSGNLINDVINARLDSATKKILSGFNFGSADYAGALNAGTVTWNTTTGAITGGSGVVVYRGGIVGVNSGATTFSIDASTGAATFAGTLSAAAGTLGALSIASGGNIRMGQTDYNTGTGFWLGDKSGTAKFSIGDGTADNSLTWDGTTLKVNGSAVTNSDIYGSGVDGAFTLDGTNTYASFFSKSGSDYTLLQDIFASSMTLSGTATLTTNGYRIFVKNTLTIGASCVIKWNGNNATNATNATNSSGTSGGSAGSAGNGGAALTSHSLYGSLAGLGGQNGGSAGGGENGQGGTASSGTAGAAISSSFQPTFTDAGGAGGKGGNANPNSNPGPNGGSAGAASALTASAVRPFSATFAIDMFDRTNGATLTYLKYNGQAGGSGGGSGGTAGAGSNWAAGGAGGGSGGNGSNGGTIVIVARIIANSGSIQAVGGNGGNGGNGGTAGNGGFFSVGAAGGGAGGGAGIGGAGGVIILVYSTLSGSGTTSVVAGSNGSVGTGAAGGTDNNGHTGVSGANGSAASTPSAGILISLVV